MDSNEEFNRLMQEEAEKDEFMRTLTEAEQVLFQSASDKARRSINLNEAVHISGEENRLLKREREFREDKKRPQFLAALDDRDRELLLGALEIDKSVGKYEDDEATKVSLSSRQRELLQKYYKFLAED